MTKKIRLKVAVSEADLGQAGIAGDVVEVEDDVAERYVAAGLAEDAGSAAATGRGQGTRASAPAAPAEDDDDEPEKPARGAGPTGRR